MGKLIEQTIDTLFQGVSRQPATVRLPGQVEEADNVVFSVVSGGFERRPGTEHVAPLDFLSVDTERAYYTYERDANEKYQIFIENGDLKVCDLEGDEKTVSFPDGKGYLASSTPKRSFSYATIADYTLIANRDIVASMDESNLSDDPDISAIVFGKDSYGNNQLIVTLNGTEHTSAGSDNVKGIIDSMYSVLDAALDASWVLDKSDEFLYIARADGADFTIAVSTKVGQAYASHVKTKAQQFSDLPKRAKPGMKVNIVGDRSSDFAGYWVVAEAKTEGDTSNLAEIVWKETVAPGIPVAFDPETMPHQLVRESDGTFTFQEVEWNERKVGDATLTPDPAFIGKGVRDISFTRDRLVLLADETTIAGQAGDYFNFWPEKALDVLDSDPVERSSPTNRVNRLNFAVPFRRSLFITSDKQQFELSAGDVFSPRAAKLEAATAYEASSLCRPVAMGDALYFTASTGNGEIVWEYIYADETLNTVAADVTKHVQGYIPSPTTSLIADPAGSTLFALTSADESATYIYQVYWDGNAKAQAAWGRWRFTDAEVRAGSVIDGYLYLIIERGDGVFMERLPVSNEFSGSSAEFRVSGSNNSIPVRLDRRTFVTGTYDSETNRTTWTLPWDHDENVVAVRSDDFSTPGGTLALSYPDSSTIETIGDYSGGQVIVGVRYLSSVTLTRIYPHEVESAITSGRLQLRSVSFDYKDASFFRVRCTPRLRDPNVWTFTGRVIGDAGNVIGELPLVSLGTFRVRTRGNAAGMTIAVESDSHTPFTITSARWVGFFNEITRQER